MSGQKTCDGCGREMGNLEQTHYWNGQSICIECKRVLSLPPRPRVRSGLSDGVSVATGGPLPASFVHTSPDVDATVDDLVHFNSDNTATAPTSPPLALIACTSCGEWFEISQTSEGPGSATCDKCKLPTTSLQVSAETIYDTPAPNVSQRNSKPRANAALIVALLIAGTALTFAYLYRSLSTSPTIAVQTPAQANNNRDSGNLESQLATILKAAEADESAGRLDEAYEGYDAVLALLKLVNDGGEVSKQLTTAKHGVHRLAAHAPKPRAIKPSPVTRTLISKEFDDSLTTPTPVIPKNAAPSSAEVPPAPAHHQVAAPESPQVSAPEGDGFGDPSPPVAVEANVPSPTSGDETSKVPAATPESESEESDAEEIPSVSEPADAPIVLTRPNPDEQAVSALNATGGIDILLDRGQLELDNGQHKPAMQTFKDAMDFDKKSPHAFHGVGLAHFMLGDLRPGIDTLEKAAAHGANRAIVHNLAVMLLRNNNPMRSARFIRDYLARADTPLDEPLQNVLGVALSAANENARQGKTFAELREFYIRYDEQLAASRGDGKKRWGMNWIQAAEAETKWKLSRTRSEKFERLERDTKRAAARRQKAYYRIAELRLDFRRHSQQYYDGLAKQWQDAKEAETQLINQRDAAKYELSSTEQPVFPMELDFIPIKALSSADHPPQM